MGNSPSYEGPFADVQLAALQSPLVAVDKRFVRPASDGITRVRMNDKSITSASLVFKDAASRKPLFLTGPTAELQTLLDAADKQPIVTVVRKDNIRGIYYAYRPESIPDTSGGFVTDANDESELLQIYVKLGDMTKTEYLPTSLRVDLTDATMGERCKIEMEGEWRARNAVLWLERSSSGGSERVPIARSFRPMKALPSLRNDFFVDIASNVDTALVMLVFALVDDVLKQERRLTNTQNTAPGAMMGASLGCC